MPRTTRHTPVVMQRYFQNQPVLPMIAYAYVVAGKEAQPPQTPPQLNG